MSTPRTSGHDLYYMFEHAAEAMPPATRIAVEGVTDGKQLETASISRFTVTYYPHYTLFLLRPVAFEFKISMAFPATPPVVRCLDETFILENGESAHLDSSGRPQLSLLTTESLGWMKSYTLADVIHCVRRCFMKEGPVVHTVSASPPHSLSLLPELPLQISQQNSTPHNTLQTPLHSNMSTASEVGGLFSFGTISAYAFPVQSTRSRSSSLASPNAAAINSNNTAMRAMSRESSFRFQRVGGTPEHSGEEGVLEVPMSPLSASSPKMTGRQSFSAANPATASKKRRGSASTVTALGLAGFSANMNGAGAMMGGGRSSFLRCGSVPSPRLVPLTAFQHIITIQAGHAALVGRRPTMEDNAVVITEARVKLPVVPGETAEIVGTPEAATHDSSNTDNNNNDNSDANTTTSIPIAFFGVYDGHGGTRASDYVASRLHHEVFAALEKGASIGEALHTAFQFVDDNFERHLLALQQAAAASSRERRESEFQLTVPTPTLTPRLSPLFGACAGGQEQSGFVVPSADVTAPQPFSMGAALNGIGKGSLGDFDNPECLDDQSGSTAIAVVIVGDTENGGCITVGNAGDSRAVLSRGGTAVNLSLDHKAKRQDERSRILSAGGMIIRGRVLGRLAVTRAIGDLSLKHGAGSHLLVTAEPEIIETPLISSDEFVITACDGIWDVMESQEAVDFVRQQLAAGSTAEDASRALAQHAFKLGSADNLSVIVTVLGDGPPPDAAVKVAPPASDPASAAPSESDFLDKLLESVSGPSRYGSDPSSTTPATPDPPGPPPALAPAPAAPPKKKDRGPNPFARSTRRAAGEKVTEKATADSEPVFDAPPETAPPVEATAAPSDQTVETIAERPLPLHGRRSQPKPDAPAETPSPSAAPPDYPVHSLSDVSTLPGEVKRNEDRYSCPSRVVGTAHITLFAAQGASESGGSPPEPLRPVPSSSVLLPRRIGRNGATSAVGQNAVAATAAALQAANQRHDGVLAVQPVSMHLTVLSSQHESAGSRIGRTRGIIQLSSGPAGTVLPKATSGAKRTSSSLPPAHRRDADGELLGDGHVDSMDILSGMGAFRHSHGSDKRPRRAPSVERSSLEPGAITRPGRAGLAHVGAVISGSTMTAQTMLHTQIRSPTTILSELVAASTNLSLSLPLSAPVSRPRSRERE